MLCAANNFEESTIMKKCQGFEA